MDKNNEITRRGEGWDILIVGDTKTVRLSKTYWLDGTDVWSFLYFADNDEHSLAEYEEINQDEFEMHKSNYFYWLNSILV